MNIFFCNVSSSYSIATTTTTLKVSLTLFLVLHIFEVVNVISLELRDYSRLMTSNDSSSLIKVFINMQENNKIEKIEDRFL